MLDRRRADARPEPAALSQETCPGAMDPTPRVKGARCEP
jgi:hypothetical protein